MASCSIAAQGFMRPSIAVIAAAIGPGESFGRLRSIAWERRV